MGEPYVGEIRMFAGTFAPVNWLFCQGQQVAISDYEVLFQLIGTTYGGDGVTSFQLPNLASRVPVHVGNASGVIYTLGMGGGSESVQLISSQIGAHNHAFMATAVGGTSSNPASNVLAQSSSSFRVYSNAAPSVSLNGSSITTAPGGNTPHANVQPYLSINFIISLFGIYPTQN